MKKYKTGELLFVRMENDSRPQQQDTTSSLCETEDDFIEVEVEETVLRGHAKHISAPEDTNIEECTPQKVQNNIPKVAATED